MRYKELTLAKVEKLDNLIKVMEGQINRNEARQTVLNTLGIFKEKLEDLRSTISIEQDQF